MRPLRTLPFFSKRPMISPTCRGGGRRRGDGEGRGSGGATVGEMDKAHRRRARGTGRGAARGPYRSLVDRSRAGGVRVASRTHVSALDAVGLDHDVRALGLEAAGKDLEPAARGGPGGDSAARERGDTVRAGLEGGGGASRLRRGRDARGRANAGAALDGGARGRGDARGGGGDGEGHGRLVCAGEWVCRAEAAGVRIERHRAVTWTPGPARPDPPATRS